MKVHEIITKLKEDMAVRLPGILVTYGLPDFDCYGIGYPTDQALLFCAVRFNRSEVNGNPIFVFTVQLQLSGVEEVVAYQYMDAMSHYLSRLETQYYGYYTGNFSIEMLENFRVSDTEIFFDYTMTGIMGDCELEAL
ncbi:MAG: hypothetical protein LBT14_07200 [Treponema sp.]|jgi:hypothetical protein|nr:hypothetical protein [Treponema sp.]